MAMLSIRRKPEMLLCIFRNQHSAMRLIESYFCGSLLGFLIPPGIRLNIFVINYIISGLKFSNSAIQSNLFPITTSLDIEVSIENYQKSISKLNLN